MTKKRRKRAENRVRIELSLDGVSICGVDMPLNEEATLVTGYEVKVKGLAVDLSRSHYDPLEADTTIKWEAPSPIVLPRLAEAERMPSA